MRALLALLAAPLGLWLLAALWMYANQRRLIFLPPPAADHGLTTITIASLPDREVIALNPGRPQAIVYFGGNAEPVWAQAERLAAALPEHSLYLPAYAGYGRSAGSPSEALLVADAIALHDALAPRHSALSAIGRSLGSAVAVQLAAARPLAQLALVTPFDSLVEVAAGRYPWLPVRRLMRERFASIEHAGALRAARVLVVLAGDDELIPAARSTALVAALPTAGREQLTLAGASHNALGEHYLPGLRAFFSTQ